jgi:UDP-glucose:(heptosyl)LPS alpha-1,3-glucosyltransferase
MKIALCYESMVPSRGGCETYIADLARRLAADQHEIHLLATVIDPAAFPPGATHHLLPPASGPRLLRPWRFARAAWAELQRCSFDVSVGFNKTYGQDILMLQGGVYAASLAHNIAKHRWPAQRFLHRWASALDPKAWSYRALERKQFFQFDSILVVPSRMVQGHLREHYEMAGPRIRIVHNAIDADRFRGPDRLLIRSQWRERCHLPADDPVGLFVGHNYRLKGLEPLLRAVAQVPAGVKFRLLVCGGKHYRPFQRLAESLGIEDRVSFLGFVGDVRALYFASDFLIHPSFYDPGALVTLEALACGLPVLTTRLNGSCELLPPLLAELTIDTPHDHAALARRIVRLCDHDHRLACSRAARESAGGWTFEHHYQRLLSIFEEVRRAKQTPSGQGGALAYWHGKVS